MKDQLPPNCPMLKADYEHYCPSPAAGPASYRDTGKCNKQEQCSNIVKDFRKMGVKTSTQLNKVLK